jgi:hypothetical protein
MRPCSGMSVLSIVVYDMPPCKWFLVSIEDPANLSQVARKQAIGERKTKTAPETGAADGNATEDCRGISRGRAKKPLLEKHQRPKGGRSPLRTAMRLLAIRRRSIEAIRRPNRVLEGRRPMDAVLDMDVPFLKWRRSSAFVVRGQLMYTRYHQQRLCLHSSNRTIALQQ